MFLGCTWPLGRTLHVATDNLLAALRLLWMDGVCGGGNCAGGERRARAAQGQGDAPEAGGEAQGGAAGGGRAQVQVQRVQGEDGRWPHMQRFIQAVRSETRLCVLTPPPPPQLCKAKNKRCLMLEARTEADKGHQGARIAGAHLVSSHLTPPVAATVFVSGGGPSLSLVCLRCLPCARSPWGPRDRRAR